jgi:hypothetical protein
MTDAMSFKSLRKYGFFLACLAALSGCGSTQKYMSQSEAELCTNHLSLPSFNVYQAARREAISRRGLDCSPYAANAEEIADARNRAAWAGVAKMGLQTLSQPNNTTNYSNTSSMLIVKSTVSGMNRLCYYNQAGSAFGLTVGAADVCPTSPSKYGSYSGPSAAIGILHSSEVSGMNRLCYYNQAGSALVRTVGAADICPQ